MKSLFNRSMALALGLMLSVAACDKSSTEPATKGTIEGTVKVVPASAGSLAGWRAQYYASLNDLWNDNGIAETQVTGSNGTFSFRFNDVSPGTYFLDVCDPASGECLFYSTTDPLEDPTGFPVQAGNVSRLSIEIEVD